MDFDSVSLSHPSTVCCHFGENPAAFHGAVAPPVFSSSLFCFGSFEEMRDYFLQDPKRRCGYTREQNPTIEIAEKKLAALEGGEAARLFGSGMAAITASILSCLRGNDHVICVDHVYPTAKLFIRDYMARFGVTCTVVSGDSVREIEDAIRENTSLIYLESPTSLTFKVQDIRAVAALARARGIRTILDNTWATPIFQRPLSLGVDLVVHSATKYLGGHSNLVAGAAIGSYEHISAMVRNEGMMLGGIIGPFEAGLLINSLRTLEMRMERHQRNAGLVAEYLEDCGRVRRINYPGLPSSPYHRLARSQMSGFSGVMSFELDCEPPQVADFLNALRLFRLGVSWGGFESLAYAPCVVARENHADPDRPGDGFGPTNIRLSVGLEQSDDILCDLHRAFASICK